MTLPEASSLSPSLPKTMVQGNPAHPIATVEIPLGLRVSLKEFAKVCDHSDNGRGWQIPLGFRKISAAELFSAAQVSRHERQATRKIGSFDRPKPCSVGWGHGESG